MSHPSWLPPKSSGDSAGHVTARMETTQGFGAPSISVSTQQPPKKFAPVVAPKPKYNPYRGGQSEGSDGDFPPPPPPPPEENLQPMPTLGNLPPPPVPDEAMFNVQINTGGKTIEERRSSLDAEIDSLTSILADLENSSPYKPRTPQGPYLAQASSLRPEDELERLTKKMLYDMENPPSEEYFGRCSRCGENVVGEGTGCTAMDQVFHVECFTCMTCNSKLRGQPFYAVEKKAFCEPCYIRTLEKCSVCAKPIMERILRATGKAYHPHCFTCVVCFRSLDGIPFTVDASGQIHCIEDFHKKFAPRCSVCKEPIMPAPGQEETVRIVALDRDFHVQCYRCEDCGSLLSEGENQGCYPLDGHILCKACNAARIQALTAKSSTDL
ncbi:lipoma-preferred partner [Xenopus tropicalis]|uniref:LIM domain-containing preferred translocation partner in lipoma n=1 Tax=Xenopus tropicalis TaxID=8364 RepID=A9ULA0_XENTR|nr:lipoma-preferred partner [Xenopus tropicalis]AAI57177.1 LOC100135172 protein [Xenopus tropicalis]|eukprot:NP_001107348.1 lipoma-preferred partner [Xenopus tropicalis]